MRKTITISMSDDLYEYVLEQGRYCSVSEYIRSLISREQQRQADYRAKLVRDVPVRARDTYVFVEALEQLDKLRNILERKGR